VADVHNGWVEALRGLGEQVALYNLDSRLVFYDAALMETGQYDESGRPMIRKALTHTQAMDLAAERVLIGAYKFWPDVILIVSAFYIPDNMLEMMRGRGHKVVVLHTESPYQDEAQLARGRHASLNLLNDPVNIEAYRQLGVPALYVPHAYRPQLHCPGPADERLICDLSFVGTGYPSRIRFFEAMDLDGIDTLLAGNWMPLDDDSPLSPMLATEKDECLDNEQTVDVYRSSKIGINLYRHESEAEHTGEGWAMGPREVEMAATGLCYLRDPRGEGDEVLHMLPTFSGPQDASEKLRWWLAHEDARQKAAAAARESIADRTFENNAKALLRELDRL
jgi:spore maturation protein CgeB